MDSLTQITLGAAVGEVVLGKKVGNKAMLWGALAGTMPDMDVLANLASDEISALAFHRAITHSAAFAVIVPFAMGWLVHRLYQQPKEASTFWIDVGKIWLGLVALIFVGSLVMPIDLDDLALIALSVSTGIVLLPILGYLYVRRQQTPIPNNATMWGWTGLFFLAIFTHPLLDCCTAFGTQFLQPFSDFRVSFNNISVLDPFYTIPFLICVIWASRLTRGSKYRKYVNLAGIVLSSGYMLLTFYHKHQVNQVFQNSLKAQNIEYSRYLTTPTILNNILWNGVAEGDTAYYQALYSLMDQQPVIKEFVVIPKNRQLLKGFEGYRDVHILQWFANNYYNVIRREDGRIQLNDLRYGSFTDSFQDEDDYIFSFILEDDQEELEVIQQRSDREFDNALSALWKRLQGE